MIDPQLVLSNISGSALTVRVQSFVARGDLDWQREQGLGETYVVSIGIRIPNIKLVRLDTLQSYQKVPISSAHHDAATSAETQNELENLAIFAQMIENP